MEKLKFLLLKLFPAQLPGTTGEFKFYVLGINEDVKGTQQVFVYMKIVLESFLEEHKKTRSEFLYIPKFVNAVRFLCKQRYIVPGL